MWDLAAFVNQRCSKRKWKTKLLPSFRSLLTACFHLSSVSFCWNAEKIKLGPCLICFCSYTGHFRQIYKGKQYLIFVYMNSKNWGLTELFLKTWWVWAENVAVKICIKLVMCFHSFNKFTFKWNWRPIFLACGTDNQLFCFGHIDEASMALMLGLDLKPSSLSWMAVGPLLSSAIQIHSNNQEGLPVYHAA